MYIIRVALECFGGGGVKRVIGFIIHGHVVPCTFHVYEMLS